MTAWNESPVAVRYESGSTADHPRGARRGWVALRCEMRNATISADLGAMIHVIDDAKRHDEDVSAGLRNLAERSEYTRITTLLDGCA